MVLFRPISSPARSADEDVRLDEHDTPPRRPLSHDHSPPRVLHRSAWRAVDVILGKVEGCPYRKGATRPKRYQMYFNVGRWGAGVNRQVYHLTQAEVVRRMGR